MVVVLEDFRKTYAISLMVCFASGAYTNHVDHFLAFFDPPSPHVDLAWTFS